MRYLTKEEILYIHDECIRKYGGEPGILSESNLEMTVEAQHLSYGEADLHRIGSIFYELSSLHPFVDGNKRTALACLMMLLRLNNKVWTGPRHQKLLISIEIASNNINKVDTINRLYEWTREVV